MIGGSGALPDSRQSARRQGRIRALQDAGAQVLVVGDGQVDLHALMMELGGGP